MIKTKQKESILKEIFIIFSIVVITSIFFFAFGILFQYIEKKEFDCKKAIIECKNYLEIQDQCILIDRDNIFEMMLYNNCKIEVKK